MSDFLELLASQISGRQAAIRPRLPARFDPVSGFGGGPQLPVEVGAESESWPADSSARRTLQPSPGVPEPSPPGEPMATSVASRTHASPLPPRTDDSKRPPFGEPSAVTADAVSRATPRDSQHDPPTAGPGRELAIERDIASAANPVERMPNAPVTSAAPIVTQRAVAYKMVTETAPVPVARDGVPRTPAVPNRPPEVSISTERPAGETASAKDAPASELVTPTVVVTIGRVEVRAVPPAAPSQPMSSRPQAPRMTLDDYLKRMGGRP